MNTSSIARVGSPLPKDEQPGNAHDIADSAHDVAELRVAAGRVELLAKRCYLAAYGVFNEVLEVGGRLGRFR